MCMLCCRRVLPGLILKGLAAVLPAQLLQQAPPTTLCNGSSSSSSSSRAMDPSLLLELRACAREELAAAVAGPVYRSGHQDVPVDLQAAPPLYWPTERVRRKLLHTCTHQTPLQPLHASASVLFVPAPA
jgi:hypothetical protein